MIKKFLKKNKTIKNLYMKGCKYRNIILSNISVKTLYKKKYKICKHKKLDLKNPEFFGEKLIWLKLNDYDKNKLVSNCADKYAVREYIEKMGCTEILNDLYGVYDDANEIEWDKLPQKFVLKCTHGCEFNIICTNKDELDKEATIKQLNKWKKEKFGYESGELHYTKIKPRIICERYLETKDGFLPNDYKFMCFNGEPKLVFFCTERQDKVKFTFLDLNWNVIDITTDDYKTDKRYAKPENLEEMIEKARKLAKPFKFVRVDFYDDNGKIIFGELTFTPAGCMLPYLTDEGEKLLGGMLEL